MTIDSGQKQSRRAHEHKQLQSCISKGLEGVRDAQVGDVCGNLGAASVWIRALGKRLKDERSWSGQGV